MEKKNILIIILCVLGIVSCEKEANVKIPDLGPKLVVTSFISPQDTTIRVKVTKSIPVFGIRDRSNNYGNEAVGNATVILSNNSSSVQLLFDEEEEKYLIDAESFGIEEGKEYFLSVTTTDGLVATAQCAVPENNNTLTVQADSINNYDNSGRTQYRFIAEWRDLSSEGNYYRISAEKKETNSASHYYYLQLGDDKNLIHDDVAAVNTYKKEAVFFDYGDNNQDFEFTAYVYLLKTDVYYYHYHKSVQTYQDENPFAEPTLTYSNITGGLGVFCAYNQTTVAIEL